MGDAGGRGCGEVTVLWHKDLEATPIGGLSSDRICGIRVSDICDQSVHALSQSGVGEQLAVLERVVLESKLLGSVVVMGDFNAHLGSPGGVHSCNAGSNVQGVLLDEMMRRCDLYAVSDSEIVTGPDYTYVPMYMGRHGRLWTMCYWMKGVASMVSSCAVHEMEDLIISDHLPISMELSGTVAKTDQQCDFQ